MPSDSSRAPKFAFVPKPRAYGKLDISHELIVCAVTRQGELLATYFPKSWADATTYIGSAAARAERERDALEWNASRPERKKKAEAQAAEWNAANPDKKPRTAAEPYPQTVPEPMLLVGLNEHRDAYEIVYDPHDLGGLVDPMMLLNFRRRV